MTRNEFLSQLREALKDDLSGSAIQENINYYNQYISEEVAKGKSEEEVLGMLGDPWIIARTIIDAADGTDRSTVYESGGSTYSSSESKQNYQKNRSEIHEFRMDTWWKKLLLILSVVMVVVLVVTIISGLVQLLAPILIPILIIMIVIRIIGNRRT